MAEVIKDDKGQIARIVYRDATNYTAEIERHGEKVRVWTKGPDGGGRPCDLEPSEAQKLGHDLADLAGLDR